MFYDKIVAIDDDPRVLEGLALILRKKCEVIGFTSPQDALVYLGKTRGIGLVMVDVHMKGIDGISALYEIKKINRHIAVIVMTAFSSKDVILEALRNHADDFIEKPFVIDEVRGKVKRFLKRPFTSSFVEKPVHERIKEFVKKNSHDVLLRDIAEGACLSEKHIGRLFKEKNRCTFRAFKIKAKMDKAKQLLKETSYTINQISALLGYQYAETFTRIFKRKTKFTPFEYRQLKTADARK